MDVEGIRKHCMSLPHVTESVQWGYDLVFKIAGKMFAVTPLEVAPVKLSLKVTPEKFQELCEVEDIIPAPYMARNSWVAFRRLNVLRDSEFKDLLSESYRLVYEKLPNKMRAELEGASPKKAKSTSLNKAKSSPVNKKARKAAAAKR